MGTQRKMSKTIKKKKEEQRCLLGIVKKGHSDPYGRKHVRRSSRKKLRSEEALWAEVWP